MCSSDLRCVGDEVAVFRRHVGLKGVVDGQAAVFGGGDGVVGLQLVEFDTGFEQGLAVFDVA